MNWDLGEDRTVASGQATNGDPLRYIVSPLRGLQAEAMSDPVVASGLGIYEQARARQDMNNGLMTAEDLMRTRSGAQRVDGRIQPTQQGDTLRVKDSRVVPKSYLELMSDIEAKAAAKTAGTTSEFKTGLDRVKSDLEKTTEAANEDAKPTTTVPSAVTIPGSNTEPNPLIPGSGALPDGGEAQREADRVKERGKLLSIPDMAEILRHGRTVDQLGTTERRRVDDLVRQGEDALKNGEYFQAERRFNQAQAIASDNPLVEVGIAHAQIGAGMFLSAGLTLRNLFNAHPELIDTKYEAKLLPTGERLAKAKELMRTRIGRGDDTAGYGLVLAYIGHQTGERAMVEEGLAAMSGNESIVTTRNLLTGVWLGSTPPSVK